MADTAVVEVKPAEPLKLQEKHFLMEEQFVYARASVTLPVGWAFEECLKPEFWVNVAPRFQKQQFTGRPELTGAIIAVRSEDHAFFGEVYVRAVRERDLIVAMVRPPVYFGEKNVDTAGYEVRWNVGKRKFDIIRRTDREIVGDAATKELASEWISKTMGTAKAA